MKNIIFKIYDKELKESHMEYFETLCEDDYWYDGETEVWSVLYDCNHDQERFVALQYTGLKDKNGKEIFEGDIVKYNEFWEGDCHYDSGVGQILWDDEETGFYLTAKDTSFIDLFNLTENLDAEVIGNIYDNPELLENKE